MPPRRTRRRPRNRPRPTSPTAKADEEKAAEQAKIDEEKAAEQAKIDEQKAAEQAKADEAAKADEKKAAEEKAAEEKARESTSSCRSGQININTASKKDLTRIDHVGGDEAVRIEKQRPFTSLKQLVLVKGISDDDLRDILEEGRACI